MKVAIVLGTRPEIIRLSKVIEGLDRACEVTLVHTGQNFDPALSDVFFDELGVRAPDHLLAIEGEGFAARVGAILAGIAPVFERERPDRLLVLGDTDSAMSAYVAKRTLAQTVVRMRRSAVVQLRPRHSGRSVPIAAFGIASGLADR